MSEKMNSNKYNTKQKRVLEEVKKILEELFPSKICKFSKVCSGYRKESYTCQHENETEGYCGLYKRHQGIIKLGEIGKLMKGTEFGDFDV